jgi:hypothetical protein
MIGVRAKRRGPRKAGDLSGFDIGKKSALRRDHVLLSGLSESLTKTQSPAKFLFYRAFLELSGCWTRTNDPLINSQLLYQLS